MQLGSQKKRLLPVNTFCHFFPLCLLVKLNSRWVHNKILCFILFFVLLWFYLHCVLFCFVRQDPWAQPMIFLKRTMWPASVSNLCSKAGWDLPFYRIQWKEQNAVFTWEIIHALTCQINQVAQQSIACPPLSQWWMAPACILDKICLPLHKRRLVLQCSLLPFVINLVLIPIVLALWWFYFQYIFGACARHRAKRLYSLTLPPHTFYTLLLWINSTTWQITLLLSDI